MTHPLDTSPTPALGWSPERKALFLDRLSAHGNARAACRAVGLSAESAYKTRRRDPLFARAWAAAVVLGRDASVQALAERAVEGVEEEIYYRGELIGTRRRYDSRLLLAHLARLDKLADEQAAGDDAGHFDELLAAIAGGARLDMLPERTAHVAAAAQEGEESYRQFESEHDLFDDEDYDLAEAERERRKAARLAGSEAAEQWDERQARVFAVVDALDATVPLAVAPRAASAAPPLPAALLLPPRTPVLESFPCTLSTVSTTALAAALAGPRRTRHNALPHPRSPFSAPKRL